MFKFRLNSLKKHREFLLTEAQTALGAALSDMMRIEAEIKQLDETIERQCELFEQEQKNGIRAPRYFYFKNHLALLERELLLAYKKLQKALRKVEERRQAMIECDKSVKTLESIETRDRELYRLIESRKEQKRLDDSAVLRQ